LRLLLKTT